MIRRVCLPAAFATSLLLMFGVSTAAAQPELMSFVRVALDAPTGVSGTVEASAVDVSRPSISAMISGGASVELGPLEPGRYEIRVAIGRESTAATITVGPLRRMVLRASAETHEARPTLAVADEYRRSHTTTFLQSEIQALPSAVDFWALVETAAPFVITDRTDGGGFGTGSSTFLGSRGASWTSLAVTFGDTSLPYPLSDGTVPFVPDMQIVDSVIVGHGPLSIDTATGGTSIVIVPKRPGSRRAGALDASFSPPAFIAEGGIPTAPPIGEAASWSNVAGHMGGPIRNGLDGLFSATAARAAIVERGRPFAHAATSRTIFGQLSARPANETDLRVVTGLQRVGRPFSGRAQFASRDVQEHGTFWQTRLALTRSIGSWVADLSAGAEGATLSPDIESPAGGTVDRVLDGVVPDPAAHLSWTNANFRFGVSSSDVRAGGLRHRLRLAGGVGRVSATQEWLAAPNVAEAVNGVPARAWVTELQAEDSSRRTSNAWFGVHDEIAIDERLTVDVGVRAEHSGGSSDGGGRIAWNVLSPRVAFRWALKGVTLYGGASHFYEPLRTDIFGFADVAEPTRRVHRWNDANANGRLESPEIGPLVALAGRHASYTSLDPDVRAPKTGEATLSAETRFPRAMTLRLTAVWRRQRNLIRAINTGVPLSSYDVIRVPDLTTNHSPEDDGLLDVYSRRPSSFGQDRFFLTNVPDEDTHHEGLELEWELRTARWYAMAGASASRSIGPSASRGFRAQENDSGVIGERGGNPNASTFTHWRLFFDRAYVLKWSTSFRPSPDWITAFTARYQDGQPFSRLVVVPDLPQGAEIVSADEPGTTRFTFLVTLDARVERAFRVGGRSFAARLDVFNLTNHRNEVEENAIGGPGFRTISAVQPPRTVRVGVRFDF